MFAKKKKYIFISESLQIYINFFLFFFGKNLLGLIKVILSAMSSDSFYIMLIMSTEGSRDTFLAERLLD